MSIDANQSESHRHDWGPSVLQCISPKGSAGWWLCGWKVEQSSWNTYRTCCCFISSTVSRGTWGRPALFVHGPAALDLFDCSVRALLHTGIPWKHMLTLKQETSQSAWMCRQISFVFPSFMGIAKVFFLTIKGGGKLHCLQIYILYYFLCCSCVTCGYCKHRWGGTIIMAAWVGACPNLKTACGILLWVSGRVTFFCDDL